MGQTLPVRLLLAAGGLTGLGCLAVGLVRIVSVERTPAAVADERSGHLLVLVACLALLAVALLARRVAPAWVGAAVAAPALLCGALVVLAGGTLLPQLVALPAVGLALVGLGGLVAGRR